MNELNIKYYGLAVLHGYEKRLVFVQPKKKVKFKIKKQKKTKSEYIYIENHKFIMDD